MSFNTAISQLMIFMNAVQKEEVLPKKYAEGFVKMLYPIAPFVTEEIWNRFGHNNTITYEEWPSFDESKLVEDSFEVVIQVNGKVRGKMTVTSSDTEEDIKKNAKEIDNVKKYLDGEIIKEIVVPKKLVSFVIKK